MALTDTAIRKIKPTDKSYKLTDSAGLYLLIKPNGSKLWYMKYRIDGKEKKLAFALTRMFPCLRRVSFAMPPAPEYATVPTLLIRKSHNRKRKTDIPFARSP